MQQATTGHVWQRQWLWHWAWCFLLGATTLVAFFTTTGMPRWQICCCTLLFVGWYVLVIGRLPTEPRDHAGRVLLYFVGACLLFGWLLTLHPIYYFLVSALYMQTYIFLPLRWAMLVAICLTGIMIWSLAVGTGTDVLPFWTIAGMVFSTMLGIGLAAFIDAIIRQSSERHRLILELESARSSLATVEREAGALQERTRLAGEIHDTLAQGFISIILHLEAATYQLPATSDGMRQHLDQALQVGRESLAEARRLVWALRPMPLEQASLPQALQRVAQRWSEESAVSLQFNLSGEVCPAHPHVEVTLLRFLQESLANVRKHAQAQMVRVSLAYLDDLITLDVKDDGRGFDVRQPILSGRDALAQQGGWGLAALQTRMQTLGGTFAIESTPGHGTTVAVAVPLLLGADESTSA